MITFACKKIKRDELVRCSFDLSKTEYDVLTYMLEKKRSCRVSHLVDKMGLERTTIQKAMSKLVRKKLAKRIQVNLPRGGYVFSYEVNKKEDIKNQMKHIFHRWYKRAEEEIDRL